MTTTRIRCKVCREFVRYNIKKDETVCPTCGNIIRTVANGTLAIREDDSLFRWGEKR